MKQQATVEKVTKVILQQNSAIKGSLTPEGTFVFGQSGHDPKSLTGNREGGTQKYFGFELKWKTDERNVQKDEEEKKKKLGRRQTRGEKEWKREKEGSSYFH